MSLIRAIIVFIIVTIGSIFGVKIPETAAPVLQNLPKATTTAVVTSTTKKNPPAKLPVKTVVQTPLPSPISSGSPAPAPSTKPAPDFEKINTYTRAAVVNIMCTLKGSEDDPASATGVMVSGDGLILTNAHVAQYYLLRDYREKDFVTCVIRTGSPAQPRYRAELVYISPAWIKNNVTTLKEENAKGTGENDFAFLRVTERIDGSQLTQLPYVTVDTTQTIEAGDIAILVSYPAGFLGGISVLTNLSVASAITTIQKVFTFGQGDADLISIGGTILSQKGSSGGAVVNGNRDLVGIISTSSLSPTTDARELYAITPSYISRTLENELDLTWEQFVSQDLAAFAQKFQTKTAPALTKLLTDELNKR